jgi:GNAT superfamily N-acetyltransferase
MRPTTLLQPADSVSKDALVEALNLAYRNYYRPLHLTPDSFTAMADREAVALDESVVATDGERVVGMALLGVRPPRGWIGGVGVIPAYRQRGIARAMTKHLLEQARRLGLETLQLEVITLNDTARRLYESLGFVSQRRLLLLTRQPNPRPLRSDDGPLPRCEAIPPDEALSLLANLDRVNRAWSRDAENLSPISGWFEATVALDRESKTPVGVCLFSAHPFQVGLITLAGTPQAGVALLNALHAAHPEATVSYFNVPEDDPMTQPLLRAGYQESLAQFEMFYSL